MSALESNHNNTKTPVVEQSNQFTKILITAESYELGTSAYASHLMLPNRLLDETTRSENYRRKDCKGWKRKGLTVVRPE